MKHVKHFTAFYDLVVINEHISTAHISLYLSLFQFWGMNKFQNPVSISRKEVMDVSKIRAKATYHKVIKELNEFGLINYRPSFNPYRGSEVDLIRLSE